MLNYLLVKIDLFALFSAKGLEPVAEKILSYLDHKSLRSAELVCKEWRRVIEDGMLWKRLIQRKVLHDSLWRGLGERKGWIKSLRNPSQNLSHASFRALYPKIVSDINVSITDPV